MSAFDDAYDSVVDQIPRLIGKWTSEESGWVINKVVQHEMSVVKSSAITGQLLHASP